ncbi:solute carrier family 12 member 7, partial [Hyalella azteca]|uniref:Solute carrier family 12 member 7 n=1 Tax=Hyalella azteca TaxID=294128 RepID=A0A979FKF0_HYAAZ
MAGINRSGDLANPQKSLPLGTLSAIGATSLVYLTCLVLFGATFDNLFARDRWGDSVFRRHVAITTIAWPHMNVFFIGAVLAAVGAATQALVGAPRILQAVAQGAGITGLAPFARTSARGGPLRALMLTAVICLVMILMVENRMGIIGIRMGINLSTSSLWIIVSTCFLVSYGAVNLASLSQSYRKTYRCKYHHWTMSFMGLVLCMTIMFMVSWLHALVVMGV